MTSGNPTVFVQPQIHRGGSMGESIRIQSRNIEDPGLPLAMLSACSHHSNNSQNSTPHDTRSRAVRFNNEGLVGDDGRGPPTSSPVKRRSKMGSNVARLRANFDASFNESVNSMDASWAQFNVDDNEEEDDEEQKGKEEKEECVAKARGNDEKEEGNTANKLESLNIEDDASHMSSDDDSLASLDRGMDAGTNPERAMQQSRTFHESFLRLGEGDEDAWVAGLNKQRYGRGSVFLWADQKLANSKIVQSRLEKAAIKLQKFFRRCLVIFHRVSEERLYLQNEKVDIQRRLQEELDDIKKYIREEEEQFQCELDQEMYSDKITSEEWDSFQNYIVKTKPEIQQLKTENERLQMECKKIRRHNEQLKVRDPEKEQERKRLHDKVDTLEVENDQWLEVRDRFISAIDDAKEKRDILREKRQTQRQQRKKLELVVSEIVEFVEDEQGDENPRLCEKLKKLKKHRDKRLRKMKRRMTS